MITEAQIKSIDYAGNSCTVRIPLFETAGNPVQCILTANIMVEPGIGMGFKEDDTVWVEFKDDHLNEPIVVGKIYTNANTHKNSVTSINTTTLKATGTVELPGTAKITLRSGSTTLQSMVDSITGASTGSTSYAPTVKCVGLCTNIAAYKDPNFSYVKSTDGLNYLITYNGTSVLNEGQAKRWMVYMTGSESLPELNQSQYPPITLDTVDGRIYYVYWDSTTSQLILHIMNDESLDDRIKRLIEESTTAIALTDMSADEITTQSLAGAQTTDITTESATTKTSNKVEVIDMTEGD